MFSSLKQRYLHGSYLRHEDGIKKFAERSMGQLIHKVTRKSRFYREQNENLLVEKANLRMRRDELYERAVLDAGEFFSTRRLMWAYTALVVLFIAAGIAVNVVSAYDFIGDGLGVGLALRWIAAGLLAVVLTFGGMLATERLIDTYARDEADDDHFLPKAIARHRGGLLVIWAVLLVCLELAIVGIAQVEATAISGDSGMLYLSFIVAAAIFPIGAGAFRWYTLQYIDRYKATVALRQLEGRLAQIDSILRQNEEFESNFYKLRSIETWDDLNEFKTLKENINQRNGIEEPLGDHFAQSYDRFQGEAQKRYAMDIRDATSSSMRRLELVDKKGSKSKEKSAPSKLNATNGDRLPTPANAEAEDSDDFFSLKPVR